MQSVYYQADPLPSYQSFEQQRNSKSSPSTVVIYAVAAVFACLVAFVTYDVTQSNYIASRVPTMMRPAIVQAARSPFPNPFAKNEDETPKTTSKSRKPFRPNIDLNMDGSLESVGKITAVGAKVVADLALNLAFNTAYFVANSWQFLTTEEQKALAKQTVDKQLPELLSLIGGTADSLGKTASAIASTSEYKELEKSAAEATEKLTKSIKAENTPAPEVIGKLKQIVADENGEVLSEERKTALAETLKKGGIKATELSLYLFYNVFSVLKNLDKVLPTPEQSGGIEGKIDELGTKVGEFVEQVKELPQQTEKLSQKVEELKNSIPTAEDLANIDPAEVSISIRNTLGVIKDNLDKAMEAISRALEEDSDFRKTLKDVSIKLKPVTDAIAKLVDKLPLPRKVDGTIDYGQLLADSGIITVKGIKALIEATKKAAASVESKTTSQ